MFREQGLNLPYIHRLQELDRLSTELAHLVLVKASF